MLLTLLLTACSAGGTTVARPLPTDPPASLASPAPRPSATPIPGCEPTRARDHSGVITTDGRTGIVGDTFAVGDLLNGGANVVRRGTIVGDQITVRFAQIGNSAPAAWVEGVVPAAALASPWGDAAFWIGWKGIAFEDSCWRLIIDGVDTGIVLAVGH